LALSAAKEELKTTAVMKGEAIHMNQWRISRITWISSDLLDCLSLRIKAITIAADFRF